MQETIFAIIQTAAASITAGGVLWGGRKLSSALDRVEENARRSRSNRAHIRRHSKEMEDVPEPIQLEGAAE